MTIKNVIFDLGNVLIDFHPLKHIKSLGYDNQKALEILNATIKDEIWNEMDRGTYKSKDEYLPAFYNKYPNLKDEIKNVLDNDWMTPIIKPMQDNLKMIDLVKSKGLKYYILSNYPKDAFVYTYNLCPFIREADGMLISYQILHVKPEKEMYLTLLEKYDLKASECLFIDDRKENVEAAIDLGINAFVFKDLDEGYKKLEEYLEVR